jgi:histidine triad (HIT) family protein
LCGFVAGVLPSSLVGLDDLVVAIRYFAPLSPTNILVLPREHIASAVDLTDQHATLLGRIFATSADLARSEGIAEGGYRVVTNIGSWGGQSVDHLHFHLMGGRPFTWPPG